MGAGGHRCIGSMGDFLATLDLLPITAWSYYLLKHPKLHSNYSAGRRAMYHLFCTAAQEGGVQLVKLRCRGSHHPRGIGVTPAQHTVTVAAALFHFFLTCVSAGVPVVGNGSFVHVGGGRRQ